ncbi:hypothetical protein CMI37_22725 [Candidatus Pacearchaeota archaeon]|nr:hypothetical protein [Candidatus Pacearchaeota archaeon]|tara:strand:+ start:595 stop:822 length:228 start_codon:yes stop_codon:yes gene_type:complete
MTTFERTKDVPKRGDVVLFPREKVGKVLQVAPEGYTGVCMRVQWDDGRVTVARRESPSVRAVYRKPKKVKRKRRK